MQIVHYKILIEAGAISISLSFDKMQIFDIHTKKTHGNDSLLTVVIKCQIIFAGCFVFVVALN